MKAGVACPGSREGCGEIEIENSSTKTKRRLRAAVARTGVDVDHWRSRFTQGLETVDETLPFVSPDQYDAYFLHQIAPLTLFGNPTADFFTGRGLKAPAPVN